MQPIVESQRVDIEQRIVERFGDDTRRQDVYLFDDITRVPEGCRVERLPIDEAARRHSEHKELMILFDDHRNNRPFVEEVRIALGLDPISLAYRATWDEIRKVAAFESCDFYVTDIDGALLAVGTHEDEIVDGKRLLWCPF